jgi:hypothetical protein
MENIKLTSPAETIITSSTNRQDKKDDPVLEGIFNYLKEVKGKRKGQSPPSSVDEMSKFITSFCIQQFDTIMKIGLNKRWSMISRRGSRIKAITHRRASRWKKNPKKRVTRRRSTNLSVKQ